MITSPRSIRHWEPSSIFIFFESQTGEIGQRLVEENLGKVFEKSDGAIIFRGEAHGLHTRVFVNHDGLPTYEAKELGLAKLKHEAYPYDLSIVVTANEINEYFKVLLKALSLVSPQLGIKTRHVSHGLLRLPTGKMSSRAGNVITAESLIKEVETRVLVRMSERVMPADERAIIASQVAIGAIKYSILKQAPGRDIIFNFDTSLNLDGDSGPYLQYTLVRARSVLAKARSRGVLANAAGGISEISEVERKLIHFPEVTARAAQEFAPQHLVTYLTELASIFNAYYANHPILEAGNQTPYRLKLTATFSRVLATGLALLAIPIPERM